MPRPVSLRRLTPLLVALLLLLAACGGAGTGGSLTVIDALGRTVELEGPPERITVAGRAGLLIVDALYLFPVARERLVAIEERGQDLKPFLAVVDTAWAEKVMLEGNAGAEQIAPTIPDLVIAKSAMEQTLGAPLQALGIPILYVDFETPETYERDLAVLGEVLGDPGRAAEVAGFYQERLDRIAEATSGLADGDRPSVLLIQYSLEEGTVAFSVPPAGWLQTTLVRLAGGEPVWVAAAEGGGWTVVGLEQIAAWDPDQIYLVDYGRNSDGVVDQLKADPNWQALSAVQSGQIYAFPGDFVSWDQPDPRWILGLTWLFTRVQPGLAGDVDIVAEVRAFFEEMYSLDPATVEAEVISRLFGDLS